MKLSKTWLLLLIIVFCLPVARGNETPASVQEYLRLYSVDSGHARKFGSLLIQSPGGRIMPVNTYSSEILRKLNKSSSIENLNSDQFLISLLAMPDVWIRIPFIAQTNEELANIFGLTPKKIAYREVFDSKGNYKLQSRLEAAYSRMPADRTAFDKDLIKLDEKINIIHLLLNHQLLNLFPLPDAPDITWYAPGDDLSAFHGQDSLLVSRIMPWYISEVQTAIQSKDWTKADELTGMISTYQYSRSDFNIRSSRIKAELIYNDLNIFGLCKKGYLILGGLLLVFTFISMFRSAGWLKTVTRLPAVCIVFVFFFHMGGMVLRGYISGYAPWSNSYETMVYVSWATVLAGILFVHRSKLTFALATLFGGVILFVSGLNWMDPQINLLVPVLQSPWLMFHVAVIVAAYGFFGISCLLGLTNQIIIMSLRERNREFLTVRIRELTIINEMSLLIGLALMISGTFLGAIWANESWGRYWGWDPKETWALITFILYTVSLHLRLIKKWNNTWLFNIMSVLSFSSVLMTYFGVNYFLSGMHSYGHTEHMSGFFIYLFTAAAVIFLLSYLSRRKYTKYIEMFNYKI